MERVNETAVAVRQLFKKPHEKLAEEFIGRIVDVLTLSKNRIKQYAASEEWNSDVEKLVLELSEKETLEITIRTTR